tara:strand:- start:877 stop:1680 length:804 start_codon:yes stop_codon:yes gene_type:complete
MIQERFYKYKGVDLLFLPLAKILSIFFIKLNISANIITILSGLCGLFGAILFSCSNKAAILLGSFGYIFYYFLDYVDGIVARSENKNSISGMFLDIFMGPIVAISMSSGVYLGSVQSLKFFGLNPLAINAIGIIYLTTMLISSTRFAYVWLTVSSKIVEDRFQKKGHFNLGIDLKRNKRPQKFIIKSVLYAFHENFMIFSFPLIAIVNFIWNFDLRFIYPVFGIILLFPSCIYDINSFIKYGKIDEIYSDFASNADISSPIKTIYLK